MLALDVCRNAKSYGLDLTFLATGDGDLEDDFRNSGADFISLKRKSPIDLRLVYQIRQIIHDRNVQVVHSHQPVEALHLYLATQGTNTKRVMTLHGVYPDAKNQLALKFLLPRTHSCVVISHDFGITFLKSHKLKKKKLLVITNGVDISTVSNGQGVTCATNLEFLPMVSFLVWLQTLALPRVRIR